MFLLTNKFEDFFIYNETKLNIDMSFNNILLMFEMFEDAKINTYEKILIALEMMIYEYETVEDVDYAEQFEIYKYVMLEFLGIDIAGKDKKQGKKMMDFNKDAGLIYASFLSEYGIDLFKEHDKLHWKKFSELLSSLGEKTAFKQVVSYRAMKVPSAKESSQEYRTHVEKMKKLYSLEGEETQEDMENKLDSIASTFGGLKK